MVFDTVSTADIEAHPLPFDLPDGLDCLVYDSILEHLNDPWGVLAAQAEALTPDGVVIMSLPNPNAWQGIERLLHDRHDAATASSFAFTPEMVIRQLATSA